VAAGLAAFGAAAFGFAAFGFAADDFAAAAGAVARVDFAAPDDLVALAGFVAALVFAAAARGVVVPRWPPRRVGRVVRRLPSTLGSAEAFAAFFVFFFPDFSAIS
jgi:hypothetical protein